MQILPHSPPGHPDTPPKAYTKAQPEMGNRGSVLYISVQMLALFMQTMVKARIQNLVKIRRPPGIRSASLGSLSASLTLPSNSRVGSPCDEAGKDQYMPHPATWCQRRREIWEGVCQGFQSALRFLAQEEIARPVPTGKVRLWLPDHLSGSRRRAGQASELDINIDL